jgi:hypothetical protein
MTRLMIRVSAFVAALAMSVVLHAADAIDGKWQFNLQTDGGPREVAVEMKTDGELVSGTWDKAELKGTFKDGKLALSFPMTSPEAGMTADLVVDGTIEADALKGTWKFGQYAGTFTATKQP